MVGRNCTGASGSIRGEQTRVVDPLPLRRDFRQHQTLDGDEPIGPGASEPHEPQPKLRGLAGFGAVLVQRGRPHLRLQPQQIRARRGCGIRPLPACFRSQHRIRGQHQFATDPAAQARKRSRDREQTVEADLPIDQRPAHRGQHRRQRFTQDRHVDRHGLRRALQT